MGPPIDPMHFQFQTDVLPTERFVRKGSQVMRVLTVLFLVLMGLASPAHAWWDMGHMEVAAIAYGRLDDAVRPKVDALIKQHPAYPLWIKGLEGLPDSDKAQAAFVHAATWADDIKTMLSCNALCRSQRLSS